MKRLSAVALPLELVCLWAIFIGCLLRFDLVPVWLGICVLNPIVSIPLARWGIRRLERVG